MADEFYGFGKNEYVKPSLEFDGRLSVDGVLSPLCGFKIWLPIDCHDDARIEVLASSELAYEAIENALRSRICALTLVSETEGVDVEGVGVQVRSFEARVGLKVNGIAIKIRDIGRLRVKTLYRYEADVDGAESSTCSGVVFQLSSLSYGCSEFGVSSDYLGNRSVPVFPARSLEVSYPGGVLSFQLQRHWKWRKGRSGRIMAGSSPVLVLDEPHRFNLVDLKVVEQAARDACLFLTLASRHLTVVYVSCIGTSGQYVEDWHDPLRRQRSTTEEEALGPLVDSEELRVLFYCEDAMGSTVNRAA